MLRCGFLVMLLLAMGAGCEAQRVPVASPPMGWNSWDAYGLTITEAQFRDNAKVLRDKLLPFGWRYAVIDEGWCFENPEDRSKPESLRYAIDSHGRYVPTPLRFPSAGKQGVATPGALAATVEETSFAELGKWVHAQGLLFGIHIVRGIPRVAVERGLPVEGSAFHAQDAADQSDACPWDPTNWGVKDNAAGQAWYDSLLRQYAAWGVDLLKVDCISANPYKGDEIRMIRRAMDKAGRPMVLSLSPGPTPLEKAEEVAKLATMWRVSNDFWDVWAPNGKDFPQSLKGQFDRARAWSVLDIPAGHWPDLDMLPLGELRPTPGWGKARSTRLTVDEQKTMLTLWAMSRSPLILGANLTLLDDATLKLLTNREWIAIDQRGSRGRELLHEGDVSIWRAALPGGRFAVAIFNLGDAPKNADEALTALAKLEPQTRRLALVDVWTEKRLGMVAQLPAHGCVLLETR